MQFGVLPIGVEGLSHKYKATREVEINSIKCKDVLIAKVKQGRKKKN